MTTVRVDRQLCSGHGQCAANAPEVFDLDDSGYCVVLEPRPPAALLEQTRLGASSCPELAITVSEGT